MSLIANIPVTCLACSAHFRTRQDNAGKRGSCPSCGAPVQVMSRVPKEKHQEAPAPPRALRTTRMPKVLNGQESESGASNRLLLILSAGAAIVLALAFLL